MVPITGTNDEDKSSLGYILMLTLAPLYFVVIIGAIVFALIMLDRHFIGLTNFMLQQYIFIGILIIGMIVAIIVYSVSVMNAQRKIGMLRQNGQRRQANLGQLLLVIVGCMMILPIILAVFIH